VPYIATIDFHLYDLYICLLLFLMSINTTVLELDLQLLCRLVTETPARFYLVVYIVMHVRTNF
jgi:uncharacterized membrane protein YdjX (TVP38/TMEM64 family)